MNDRLDALLQWYASLTPQSLAQLDQFYAADARFKDPFNEVCGVPAIQAVFAHMFSTTEAPRFIILTRMCQGQEAFATWRFVFALNGRPLEILGASHLTFDADGKISLHRDYWDAAEELWQKLPLLGPVVGWLRRRFRA